MYRGARLTSLVSLTQALCQRFDYLSTAARAGTTQGERGRRSRIDYISGVVSPAKGGPIGLRLVAQPGLYAVGRQMDRPQPYHPGDLVALYPSLSVIC